MKTIELRNGWKTLVSEEDFSLLSKYSWVAHKGYAVACVQCHDGVTRQLAMHRLILPDKEGFCIDHINGEKMDNRRENLRYCTHRQNMANRVKRRDSKCNYKGVTRSGKKWIAAIICDGVRHHLGTFHTEISAALAYNRKCNELFGSFARPNLISEEEAEADKRAVTEIEAEIAHQKALKLKGLVKRKAEEKRARLIRMFKKDAFRITFERPRIIPKKKRTFSPSEQEKLARYRAMYAVKVGKLKQEKCECCGAQKTAPYHEDINFPYLVRWLCAPCEEDVRSYVTLPPKKRDPRLAIRVLPGEKNYVIKSLPSEAEIRREEEKKERKRRGLPGYGP